MSVFFIKTVINNLCRAVKIRDDEEITIAQFVERGNTIFIAHIVFAYMNMDLNPVNNTFVAFRAHELDASEVHEFEFSLSDSDHLPIDDIEMIKQWKSDASFKVIIDLKVSRKKVQLVAEVCIVFVNQIYEKVMNKVLTVFLQFSIV